MSDRALIAPVREIESDEIGIFLGQHSASINRFFDGSLVPEREPIRVQPEQLFSYQLHRIRQDRVLRFSEVVINQSSRDLSGTSKLSHGPAPMAFFEIQPKRAIQNVPISFVLAAHGSSPRLLSPH